LRDDAAFLERCRRDGLSPLESLTDPDAVRLLEAMRRRQRRAAAAAVAPQKEGTGKREGDAAGDGTGIIPAQEGAAESGVMVPEAASDAGGAGLGREGTGRSRGTPWTPAEDRALLAAMVEVKPIETTRAGVTVRRWAWASIRKAMGETSRSAGQLKDRSSE